MEHAAYAFAHAFTNDVALAHVDLSMNNFDDDQRDARQNLRILHYLVYTCGANTCAVVIQRFIAPSEWRGDIKENLVLHSIPLNSSMRFPATLGRLAIRTRFTKSYTCGKGKGTRGN